MMSRDETVLLSSPFFTPHPLYPFSFFFLSSLSTVFRFFIFLYTV